MTRRSVLMLVLSLVLSVNLTPRLGAQETGAKHAPRAEMIDAIMRYAGSGGCETLRNVFGSIFDEACSTPGSGTAVYILALARLHHLHDRELIGLCTRNKILDCEARQETSTGRPILLFDASLGVRASDAVGTWSPDGHRLVIYAIGMPKGQTRLIDVERLQIGPVIAEGAAPSAVAWSPNGKYIALGGHQVVPRGPVAVRLFASDTLEEIGSLPVAKENECGLATSTQMAFTPDSKGLWVNCGGSSGSQSPLAAAIKLRVPELEIEDRLFPMTIASATKFTFRTYAISTGSDGLELTGTFQPARQVPPDYQQQMAVQSFSLQTKTPLHPPVLINLYYGDREAYGSRTAWGLHLIRDLSAVLVHFPGASFSGSGRTYPEVAELWSTEGRGRLDAGPPGTMLERYLSPNRIGTSGFHLTLRYLPNSSRQALTVVHSRSRDIVQEIGPIPSVLKSLVSPDGSRVAFIGSREIRFYRVDLNEAAAAAAQRR